MVAVNMETYLHELDEWPTFRWNAERLAEPLAAVSRRQGLLIGHMAALGFQLRAEAVLATLTEDVLKSSEIEGEVLDKEQVRSSIARRLGMDIGALARSPTGIYAQINAGTVRFLDQRKVLVTMQLLYKSMRSSDFTDGEFKSLGYDPDFQ